jgi:DNA-directed RNA polymerase alpha subunit
MHSSTIERLITINIELNSLLVDLIKEKKAEELKLEQENALQKLYNTPFYEFELSVRAANCLSSYAKFKFNKNQSDITFGDIAIIEDWELLREPNFGKKSLKEWKDLKNNEIQKAKEIK